MEEIESTPPKKIEINNRDPNDQEFCTVRIDDGIGPSVEIETRMAIRREKQGVPKIVEWVKNVRKSGETTIGISAEIDKNSSEYRDQREKRINRDIPFDILQFCAGNQCLLYAPSYTRGYFKPKKVVPKALRDLLSDVQFTVAGVGIEEVVRSLERELGLKISRAKDLGKMAGLAHDVGEDYYCGSKFGVGKLADSVLKEDWREWTNPRGGIMWWKDKVNLSDEKVKQVTLAAFLAYKMGNELSKYA